MDSSGSRQAADVAPGRFVPGAGPLEFAVAAAGVGIFEIDIETGEQVWSDLTLAMYGLPPGSVPPTRAQWRERFLHPADAERAQLRVEHFFATREPYDLEYRIRRADGALRWLHTRVAFAYPDSRRVFGISIDITERKRAEQQAQEAWRALDISATQVGFGFGWRDPQGNQREWSPQLKRLCGFDPFGPTPDAPALLALLAPPDRVRLVDALRTPLGPAEVRSLEFDVRRADNGEPRTLLARLINPGAAEGLPERWAFVVVDVTELRAVTRRHDELLQRLQLATAAGGLGVWLREPAGGGRWDERALFLHGLPADAVAPGVGALLARVHADDHELVLARWLQLAPGEEDIDLKYRVHAPDGVLRWLHTKGRQQIDAAGRMLRQAGITLDITRQQQAESAQHAAEMAERANRAKTDFLSRVSHELRTPLNAMLGFAQLMASDASQPLAPAQRQRVEFIETAGWQLLALIEDVLAITRIEAGPGVGTPTALPLPALLEDALAALSTPAREAGVALQRARAWPPSWRTWADRPRLLALVHALLERRLRGAPGGARLLVDVQPELASSDGAAGSLIGYRLELRVHGAADAGGAESRRLVQSLLALTAERLGCRLDCGTDVWALHLPLPPATPARPA
jgi:PAS domain S-box-containing protein